MVSVQDKIERKIKEKPAGAVFFPQEFRTLGTDTAIKMALSRLAKDGLIERVSHGIYTIPKVDPVLGRIPPAMEDIATAIARRDHMQIRPSGNHVLQKLGLSTQVPMKLVYVTDGAPRTIHIGKRSIRFKPTTPKKLATKGQISGLVIQALETLGKDGITPEISSRIEVLLQKEDPKHLRHDALIAPAWIAKILLSTLQETTV